MAFFDKVILLDAVGWTDGCLPMRNSTTPGFVEISGAIILSATLTGSVKIDGGIIRIG